MTGPSRCRSLKSLVTKFLREALTAEALGVPKLEAMARAAIRPHATLVRMRSSWPAEEEEYRLELR